MPVAEPTGLIFSLMRYAVHDGPGIRTVVFFKGCPLACPWCHNPESRAFQPDPLYFAERCLHCGDCAQACPHDAIRDRDGEPRATPACARCGTCVDACPADARQLAGRSVTVPELLREIERDVVFFDESGGGVTLSGGEPLSQPAFAEALLDACRQRRIHTAIETCGFAQRATLTRVCARADLVLFDLKAIDPILHQHHTGVPNQVILANLRAVAAIGRPLIVRIPVVPGVNDTEAPAFARTLAAIDGVHRVDLLPYHRLGDGKLRRLTPSPAAPEFDVPTPAQLSAFQSQLNQAGLDARIGG